jgi:hypothetical protein
MSIEAPFSAYFEVATVAGGESVRVNSLRQIAEHGADPEAFAATHFGMTVEQYRLWLRLEGALRCTGHTARGRPCRNTFASHLPARDWLAACPTARCHLHSGNVL